MKNKKHLNIFRYKIVNWAIYFALVFVFIFSIIGNWKLKIENSSVAHAAFNNKINYQGKLTDASGNLVPDGNYNMEFKIYDLGDNVLWTETWCKGPACSGSGTDNRVVVKNGLFSVLIGTFSSLSGINFNQTLKLGVTIGGSGSTPSWDSEMSPRKTLGAVPAAFESDKLDGYDESAFALLAGRSGGQTLQGGTGASESLTLNSTSNGTKGKIYLGSNSAYDEANVRLGIGTTSPTNALSVSGNANFTGHIAIGNQGVVDTTPAWYGSSALSSAIMIGQTVSGNLSTVNYADITALTKYTHTGANPANIYGATINPWISNTSSGDISYFSGLQSESFNFGAGDVAILEGAFFAPYHAGSGIADEIRGIYMQPTVGSGASANTVLNIYADGRIVNGASATDYYGGYSVLKMFSSTTPPTLTNNYNWYLANPVLLNSATVTNNYGLYIENQTAGSTLNYSIYSGGGYNYFGGVVDSNTGFRYQGAAASGNYLRGNGTNFVSSAIQAGDLPDIGSTYFKQNGNSYGAEAVLGTNDSQDLSFEVNNTTIFTIDADTGNILPSADSTYDLGSHDFRWHHVYMGGNSLHVGESNTHEVRIGYDGLNDRVNFYYGEDTTAALQMDLVNQTIGLQAGTSGYFLAMKANASQAANVTYTWPTAPTNGYVLSTDSSGNLSWLNPATIGGYWTVSGNNIYNNNSGNVGIGTASPTTKLHVSGSSGTSGISVVGTSPTYIQTQTTLIDNNSGEARFTAKGNGSTMSFNLQASDGLSQIRALYIDSTGNVGIGTATPTWKLEVDDNKTNIDDGGVYAHPSMTATSSGLYYLTGVWGDVSGQIIGSGVTNLSGYSAGLTGSAYVNSNSFQGRLGRQYGVLATAGVYDNAGAGTVIDNSYGGYFEVYNKNANATITNAYGIRIGNNGTTGTITNRYGLYIDTGSVAGAYDIYTSNSNAYNYFAGNVGIGDSTPTDFKLEVSGDIGPSATLSYTLGSNTLRWSDAFIGPASLHIGNSVSDEAALSYNASAQSLSSTKGITVGNSTGTTAGTIRYTGSDIEGYVSGAWKSLTVQTTDVKQLVRSFTAASGESISAGDVVSFVNGELKKGINRFGTESALSPASPVTNVSAASLDSTHFVLAYTDTGNSNYGTAVVGSVSGNTITWGAESVFNPASTGYTSIAVLSSSKFVVAYQDIGANWGNAIVGNVSGNTISSWGAESQFLNNNATYVTTDALSSSSIVVSYVQSGSTNISTRAATIAGNVFTWGAQVNLNTGGGSGPNNTSITALSSTSFIIAYEALVTTASGFVVAGTVTGTTVAYGASQYVFDLGAVTYIDTAKLASNQFIISYKDGSGYGSAIVGSSIGTSISYGTKAIFSTTATNYTSVSALSSSKAVISYQDAGNSNYGTMVFANISGDSISPSAKNVFASAGTAYVGSAVFDSSKYIIGYQDTANSNYVTAIVGDSYQVLGVAKSAISGGSSGLVAVGGIADGFSGLSVGTTYYQNLDGTLTTTANANLLGMAVSSSELLLQNTALSGGGGGVGGTGTSYWSESSGNIYNINASNVGIGGISSPARRLEVRDATSAQLRLSNDATHFADFTVNSAHNLTIQPSSTGKFIVQPTTDSTDFFRVSNAAGTPIISVDTTNSKLGIIEGGTSPTYYTYLKGGDQSANINYTLPINDGTDGQVLRSDGTGVLSWADPTAAGGPSSSFSVHKSSDQSIASDATYHEVTFNIEDFDTNNDFSSNIFTPKVAGKYILTATIDTSSLGSNALMDIKIIKNALCSSIGSGSGAHERITGESTTYAGNKMATFSEIVDANGTTDYFHICVNQTSGSTVNLIGGAGVNTAFSGSSLAGGGTSGVVPAFSVNKNGVNQTGIVTNTWTKLTFSTKEFDTNSNFSTGTSSFAPTVPGKYLLTANVGIHQMTAGTPMSVAIYKNGSQYKVGTLYASQSSDYSTATVSAVVEANGTSDYFEAYVYHNNGSNRDVRGESSLTYFTGSRIDGGSGWWVKGASGLYYNSTNIGIGTTSPSSLLDLQKAGTVKTNTDMLEITNSGNAADMDGTSTSILFNQYYYNASTPAAADAGKISVGTWTDWTSTASTQDSYLAVSSTLDGSLVPNVLFTAIPWTTATWSRSMIIQGAVEFGYGSSSKFGIGRDANGYLDIGFTTAADDTSAAYTKGITVDGGSNVGIGRYNTANKFEVEGDASKTTAGSWLANSDARIKTDIQSIDDATSLIMDLKPVKFKYSDWYISQHPSVKNQYYYNFIAQDFAKVFPGSVQGSGEYLPDGSEILQLDPYNASVIAIAAIQEQQTDIDSINSQLLISQPTIDQIGTLDNASGTVADTLKSHEENISYLNDMMLKFMGEITVTEGNVYVNKLTVTTAAEIDGALTVKGNVAFNKDTIGQAKIKAGDTEVKITFEHEYEYQPVVTLTAEGENVLDSDFKYTVIDENTKGFTIKIKPEQSQDIIFNWHAFGSDEGKIFVSDGTTTGIEIVKPDDSASSTSSSTPPVFPNF